MRTFDFTPLFRTAVGFERLPSLMDTALRMSETVDSYPPYDIEKTGENSYRIAIAVAGFAPEDLDVEVKEGVLTVKASKQAENGADERTAYLHRGIARRAFERRFQLAEHVAVKDARLENGLLSIDLERELPEEMKPRKIAISAKPFEGKAVEHKKAA